MANQLTTIKLVLFIQENRRVKVRRLQHEFNLSQSAVYRIIRSISKVMPIRLNDGIIVLEDTKQGAFLN